MAKQTITIGDTNAGLGNSLRDAFEKIEANFTELYSSDNVLSSGSTTINAAALWNNTTGNEIIDSSFIIDASGNVTCTTINGRTIETDGAKLDTIAEGADVTTPANILSSMDNMGAPTATISASDVVLIKDASDTDALKGTLGSSIITELGTAKSIGLFTFTDNVVSTSYSGSNISLSPTGTGMTVVNNTSAMTLPSGTAAQRPGSPVAGEYRFNTDNNTVEYYTGSRWVALRQFTSTIFDGVGDGVDGLTKEFNVGEPLTENNLIVSVNGTILIPGVTRDYITYDSTLRFNEAPTSDALIEVRHIITFINSPLTTVANISAAADVDTGTDTITLTAHPFANDDILEYSNGGGASIGGLTHGDSYYVVNSAVNTIQLSLTLGGAVINLTAGGAGTEHILRKIS